MIILLLGLIFIALMLNMAFYEYRVSKTTPGVRVLNLTGVKFK